MLLLYCCFVPFFLFRITIFVDFDGPLLRFVAQFCAWAADRRSFGVDLISVFVMCISTIKSIAVIIISFE